MNSKFEVKNIDYKEISKYLAVMMTPEEIKEEKFEEIIAKRVKKSKRKLTTNCLFSKKPENEEWILGKTPSSFEKKRMLACVLGIGVKVVMENHTYVMGEDIYLQTDGCPIGLDLSQAVARAVMLLYDELYLEEVKNEGINMQMYARYVDDSNQIVEADDNENEEDIVGRLKDIANRLLDGIVMEEDFPCKHCDKKLPILDMKVWMNEQRFAKYIFYEKDVSSKELIPERSAHSSNCKKSVHISEVVRRCMNTSKDLDWETYFVPSLDDYMMRMKKAGYNERYRKNVLKEGLKIYEAKVAISDEGGEPLNRPSEYRKVERRREKRLKKKNWNKRGGYGSPIIIPSTPNGELAKMLKEVADQETNRKHRFKIVEKGGMTIERSLMRPNPIGNDKCGKEDCEACKSGSKMCHKNNVGYNFECKPCAELDAKYFGETARNLYTRGGEHLKKYNRRDPNSFIKKHQDEYHNGEPPDFKMKVVKSFKDPLSRQVSEAIHIKNHKGILLNSKSEFFQPPLVRIRQEVITGLEELV